MRPQKIGLRAEYQQQESQRVRESVSLADKFEKLKSLTVSFVIQNTVNSPPGNEVKYSVNLDNAKSVFRFACPNSECIRGDFDLTDQLADAVSHKRKSVTGELACKGWRNRASVDTLHCDNVMHYSLKMTY